MKHKVKSHCKANYFFDLPAPTLESISRKSLCLSSDTGLTEQQDASPQCMSVTGCPKWDKQSPH